MGEDRGDAREDEEDEDKEDGGDAMCEEVRWGSFSVLVSGVDWIFSCGGGDLGDCGDCKYGSVVGSLCCVGSPVGCWELLTKSFSDEVDEIWSLNVKLAPWIASDASIHTPRNVWFSESFLGSGVCGPIVVCGSVGDAAGGVGVGECFSVFVSCVCAKCSVVSSCCGVVGVIGVGCFSSCATSCLDCFRSSLGRMSLVFLCKSCCCCCSSSCCCCKSCCWCCWS